LIERYGITARLFAADCGVYLEISIPDNTVHLQIELRSVSVQKLANGSCPYLLVNNIFSVGPSNCELVKQIIILMVPNYPSVLCRDLGVKIAFDLLPMQHVGLHEIVLKANKRANYVIRCFISVDIK